MLSKVCFWIRPWHYNNDQFGSALYDYAPVNGLYLSSHSVFRGLQKTAVFGNFFRSILSIPVAIVFNMLIGSTLTSMGIVGINDIYKNGRR
jgi:hypothetical protein